jgi:hypothetical protein
MIVVCAIFTGGFWPYLLPCVGAFRVTGNAGDVFEVLAMLDQGSRRKAVAITALNSDSSRSHTIFSITVDRRVSDSWPSSSQYLSWVGMEASAYVRLTAI